MEETKQLIFKKEVDKSALTSKITVPVKAEEIILNKLGGKLQKGQSIPVTFIIDNKKFESRISYIDRKTEKSVVQIIISKEMEKYLSQELKTSYDYLINNDNKKLPDELKEYMEFYACREEDTFMIELIKSSVSEENSNEENYKEWVMNKLNCTSKTANTYASCIKKIDDVLGTDTFYIEEIDDINTVIDQFKNNEELRARDKKEHGPYGCALNRYKDYILYKVEEEAALNPDIIRDYNINKTIDFIYNYITSQGYTYNKSLIKNIYLSLKTKPFLILSGISGTGKSKIIELFARALGATAENKRFNLIPVKPDWSDSTDLLGYRNIEGEFIPGIITKICKEAMEHKDIPYFIVLDEMNLARVEYYFSDILSLMETRRVNEEGEIITNNLLNKDMLESTDNEAFIKYGNVYIPENVYIVGTVNMDETTFPFSRKVLDRANTIEFNKVNLNYDFDSLFNKTEEARVLHNDFLKSRFLKIKDCSEHKETALKTINELIKINNILEKYNFHFAYRVRDEIVFYMIYAREEELLTFHEALDNCIVQKILPKINGSSNECYEVLLDLFQHLNKIDIKNRENLDDKELNELEEKAQITPLPLASEKLLLMIRRFIKDGFTSFW